MCAWTAIIRYRKFFTITFIAVSFWLAPFHINFPFAIVERPRHKQTNKQTNNKNKLKKPKNIRIQSREIEILRRKKEKNESNAKVHTKFLHEHMHSEGGSDGKEEAEKTYEQRKWCERKEKERPKSGRTKKRGRKKSK